MERIEVYEDANGNKYYEANKNEFNLQVIRAAAMDMGIMADEFLTAAEERLDKTDDSPGKKDIPFIEACMISAEILEKAMENAEDIYEYLFFCCESVKDKRKVEAHHDSRNIRQSINDLSAIKDILETASINVSKLADWIKILTRAYKHSLVWQEFFAKR